MNTKAPQFQPTTPIVQYRIYRNCNVKLNQQKKFPNIAYFVIEIFHFRLDDVHRYHPGLEYLNSIDELLVKQKVEILEILTRILKQTINMRY